jgi:hypothetical protein
MTADNVTSIEQQEVQISVDPAEAAAQVQAGVAALLASGQAMLNGSQTMHGAMLAFLQSRAKEALSAGQRLAECGSPSDALEIQLDFAREALQAYSAQFAKLGELAGEAVSASIRPLQARAVAGVDRASDLAA